MYSVRMCVCVCSILCVKGVCVSLSYRVLSSTVVVLCIDVVYVKLKTELIRMNVET